MINRLFVETHEKGILIETFEFKDCSFPEFKLKYWDDKFILWRYIPKRDVWERYCFIEAFRITESPVDWAKRLIEEYKRDDD